MKKSMLFAGLFAMILAFNSCDSKISESDVPQVVLDSFRARYPVASAIEWKTEKLENKKIYEAMFKSGADDIEAEFHADGTFIKEE